jgi:hypothetical protein
VVRHRRRPLELLHAFVIAAALALVTGAVIGVVAGMAPMGYDLRRRLVDVEVAALMGWLAFALVGHAHKVVPFITWTELRKAGRIGKPGTPPVLFADLYRSWAARVTFVLLAAAVGSGLAGTASDNAPLVVAAGALFTATGVVALWNLLSGPRRALRRRVITPGGAGAPNRAPAGVAAPNPGTPPVGAQGRSTPTA